MATASKVYNFPMEKVENQLVSWLKRSRGSSTVADMIAGTALPKYQVEQAAKKVLDEYAGRLKVTESGELLYSFPSGMHSTVKGVGPAFRRFWHSFSKGAARVLSLLFKIWIVTMLVGYFVAFVLIIVAAILAAFAASMASRNDGRGGGGRSRGGFGGMGIVIRLFDLLLRMWFWSNILGGFQGGFGRGVQQQRKKRPDGRAFYKSVFGFVFGDEDPNAGWDEAERRYVLSYIVSHKGVVTVEELMTLTGRELDDANALMNRLLVEYEGEPGVTDDGTVIYTFPALMRTSRQDPGASVPLNSAARKAIPFSANKPRTTGWIIFFNAFNLGLGSYFLASSLAGAAIAAKVASIYSMVGMLLQTYTGIPPAGFMEIVLGIIPVAFSICFFLVPLFRAIRLRRRNAKIREEALRKSILSRILSNPAYVDPAEVPSLGAPLDSRDMPSLTRRLVEKLAAAFGAEPIPKGADGQFAYRFAELERQTADLAKTRAKVDLKKYELGETVFDTGN